MIASGLKPITVSPPDCTIRAWMSAKLGDATVMIRLPSMLAGIALIPAGPVRRAPNLYSPLWAIPKASPVKAEAWELAKWLCSPRQLLEDGLKSNAIETAPLSVLYSAEFDRHFRDDMLSTVRAGRAIAREERPFGDLGIEACTIVGDITHELLLKRWTPRTAAEAIVQRLGKLADSRGD